jgi:hypothetical protein
MLGLVEPLKAWRGGGIPKEWVVLLGWSVCGLWLFRRYRNA